MSVESPESGERKRVFRYYKGIADDPNVLNEIDKTLEKFVHSTTFKKEFYIFRSAIADTAVNSFYEDALCDWPLSTDARSNIPREELTPKAWADGFRKIFHNSKSLPDRLRWVTLGYHYDWDNKEYPPGCVSPFPPKCGQFFAAVASIMLEIVRGHDDGLKTGSNFFSNYIPEASIVNYYRKKTNMGFHVDDCEDIKEAPLISISLGRPAIFLLETSTYIPGNLPHGNPENLTKTIIPILLRHGDIMITGGHSRLAYHAVPRLLSWKAYLKDLPEIFFSNLTGKFTERLQVECNRKILEDYISSTRLNVNVRQVVPKEM